MIHNIIYVWVVIILVYILANVSSLDHSHDELLRKYPEYGTEWMYFPDEHGVPTKAYLKMPSENLTASTRSLTNDDMESITFTLYTQNNTHGTLVSLKNAKSILSKINLGKSFKFITHGYLSHGSSDTCQSIKDAYLEHNDVNIFILDWSKIASSINYIETARSTEFVGQYYAKFLDTLIGNGVKPSRIHLIGHSLGAHVSGFAGRFLTKREVGRITGLDPACPFFTKFMFTPLGSDDAEFVDIIHTCGGVLGIFDAIGDVDFYPNGGIAPQPGCLGITQIFEGCSHGRSWQYFAESINPKYKFVGRNCYSWTNYHINKCTNEIAKMGEPVSLKARGSYFLSTEKQTPYGKLA